MTTIYQQAVEALQLALIYVEAGNAADHMLDGFKPQHRGSDDTLARVRAALSRLETAQQGGVEHSGFTPGPWQVSDTSIVAGDCCVAVIEDDGEYAASTNTRAANAKLIADAPRMYDRLTALQAEVAQLRGALQTAEKSLGTIIVDGIPDRIAEATMTAYGTLRAALADTKETGK